MSTAQKIRIAVVTGSSRGLGRSMALHLAERGVDPIITYRSGEKQANEVVARIAELGRKAVALRLDVADTASFAAFAETLQKELARVWHRSDFDFLVNNAGIGTHAKFVETSEAQFDELLNVHFKGTFFLTQRLVPLLADGGSILNVSSGLARFARPGYSAYGAMKGAVEVLTRYLAKELGARRITVNVLAPGAIETDFGGGAVRDDKELNAALAAQTALGRVGQPDDIGGAVAMLLAPESRWINGQRIEASGGFLL
jgi:NAD(P)-dependent dehydrogenase (short-subunit alcohol dehydrogenase family)